MHFKVLEKVSLFDWKDGHHPLFLSHLSNMALSAMQESIKAYGLMGRSTGMQTKVGGSRFTQKMVSLCFYGLRHIFVNMHIELCHTNFEGRVVAQKWHITG